MTGLELLRFFRTNLPTRSSRLGSLVGSLASALALAGCSSSQSGVLVLVTGEETDTFTQAPVPTTLRIDAIGSTGSSRTLGTYAYPTSSIDLGSFDDNEIDVLDVTGLDATGTRRIFGQSIPIQLGGLDGLDVPLFVQRTGELARLPQPLSDSRTAPLLAVMTSRYLLVLGGAESSLSTTTQIYDFANFGPVAYPPTLPIAPTSFALPSGTGTVAWLINATAAEQYDFSSSSSAAVTPPSGHSLADVAGGATITGSDGSQYIVGATRTTGSPTTAVLVFDSSGNPSWASLSQPRLGASAAWVDGRGLVVAGGSASTTGAGAEIIGLPTGTTGAALPYAPDASVGSGAATLDGEHIVVAGGVTPSGADAGVRSIDLGCLEMCAAKAWAALPVTLVSSQAFAFGASSALVVGSEASGLTHVFSLTGPSTDGTTPGSAVEVPTKVAHTNASAAISPTGTVILFGGAAGEIESFTP